MKRFFAMLLAVCMTFCACAFAEEDGTDLSYVDVKERGALRVGMDNAYAPFCFVDETNEYTGFDVDFAYAICDALGVELEVVPIEWKNARSALEDGSVDMLLCGFTQADNEDMLRVSFPYIESGTALVVKGDSAVSAMADMAGKTLGLREGSCEADVLNENKELYQALSAAYSLPTAYELLNAVETGSVDGALVDRLVAEYRIAQGANLKFVGEPEAVWELTAAFAPQSEALWSAVNDAMVTLAFNGVLSDIASDWFGSDITVLAGYLVALEETEEGE